MQGDDEVQSSSLELATQQRVRFDVRTVDHLFRLDQYSTSTTIQGRVIALVEEQAFVPRSVIETFLQFHSRIGSINSYRIVGFDRSAPVDYAKTSLRIATIAAEDGLSRQDVFLAVGGAAAADVAGFAAALFRRSTACVRIHGHSNGVLHSLRWGARARVLVGSRTTPPAGALASGVTRTTCIIDADALRASARSQPRLIAAQAIRIGAVADRHLVDLASQVGFDTRPNGSAVCELQSRMLKAALKCAGPLPAYLIGLSPLDIGQPFQRIVESVLPQRAEADVVSVSIAMACTLASRIGLLPQVELERIWSAIRACGLPTSADTLDLDHVCRELRRWRRAGGGSLALPSGVGSWRPWDDFDVLSSEMLRPDRDDRNTKVRRSQPPSSMDTTTDGQGEDFTTERKISYAVRFTARLLDLENPTLAMEYCAGRRVLAFVDSYPGSAGEELTRYLEHHAAHAGVKTFHVVPLKIRADEKDMASVVAVMEHAQGAGIDSRGIFLGVGGGTVMDVVGLGASLYLGGVDYLRIPTTLVGMIDAGVGLKVGVNLAGKKNLLGAFYPPVACLNDIGFLEHLPEVEVRCGLAEAIKIAVVCDRALFWLIEREWQALFDPLPSPAAERIVRQAIVSMLAELRKNPFEVDVRRLPDFGHEVAHVIESLSNYEVRHGEAVAVGMALSSCLSWRAGKLPKPELDVILGLLGRVGLPTYHSCCTPDAISERIMCDVLPQKAGHLHLVVPEGIGRGGFIDDMGVLNGDALAFVCDYLSEYSVKAGSMQATSIPYA